MASVGFVKTFVPNGIPIYQGKKRTAQGGFTLDTTNLAALFGAVIPAGTPMAFNEATRLAVPILGAKLTSAALNTDTAYQVQKNQNPGAVYSSLYAVGQIFTASKGGAAYAVTAINTSNAGYDILTLGTTLGVALPAGTNLQTSSAAGAAAGAYGTVGGLLFSDTVVDINTFVDVVIGGVVYARRCTVPADISAYCPDIVLSYSF